MSSVPFTLREDEIRPEELMREQARRFEADIARIVARRGEFVQAPCPSCGSGRFRPAFQKYEMEYVFCEECETMFINPRPTPAVLEMYYSSSENYAYWNEHIFPASENARREKIFRPRAERVAEICRRYKIPTGLLLEVGAGFGTFCEELRSMDIFDRLLAVEPTPSLASTCRQRGLEVIEQPIEHAVLDGVSADVVASFEVIEHLFSPLDYVSRCARLLVDGGLFIATCPNIRGFDMITLGSRSTAIDPEHLNYFHPESLARLVESCGLTVLEVQTPGKLDAELVRKSALTGEIDLSNQPFLEQILIEEWDNIGGKFQEFLAANRLSSHMWLVAQKVV